MARTGSCIAGSVLALLACSKPSTDAAEAKTEAKAEDPSFRYRVKDGRARAEIPPSWELAVAAHGHPLTAERPLVLVGDEHSFNDAPIARGLPPDELAALVRAACEAQLDDIRGPGVAVFVPGTMRVVEMLALRERVAGADACHELQFAVASTLGATVVDHQLTLPEPRPPGEMSSLCGAMIVLQPGSLRLGRIDSGGTKLEPVELAELEAKLAAIAARDHEDAGCRSVAQVLVDDELSFAELAPVMAAAYGPRCSRRDDPNCVFGQVVVGKLGVPVEAAALPEKAG